MERAVAVTVDLAGGPVELDLGRLVDDSGQVWDARYADFFFVCPDAACRIRVEGGATNPWIPLKGQIDIEASAPPQLPGVFTLVLPSAASVTRAEPGRTIRFSPLGAVRARARAMVTLGGNVSPFGPPPSP
jgi:hypothetical protein